MVELKKIHNITHISVVTDTINNDEGTKLRALSEHGIQCGFVDDQWDSPQMTFMRTQAGKSVVCKFDRMLIGPDGLRYHCVAKLMNRIAGFSAHEAVQSLMKPCNMYGNCSACDVMVHRIQFT